MHENIDDRNLLHFSFPKQIAEKLKTVDKLQRHKKTAERKLLTETAEKLGALREVNDEENTFEILPKCNHMLLMIFLR